MKRRKLFGALGAEAALHLTARAQQLSMPVIGYLANAIPEGFAALLEAFRRGLAERANVEGRNVATEYRWADGDADRLPGLAVDWFAGQSRLSGCADCSLPLELGE